MCILKKQKTWGLCFICGCILANQFHCRGYSNTGGLYVASLTLKNQFLTQNCNCLLKWHMRKSNISNNISEKLFLDWFVLKKKVPKRCVFHQYFKIQLKLDLWSAVVLRHYIQVFWTTAQISWKKLCRSLLCLHTDQPRALNSGMTARSLIFGFGIYRFSIREFISFPQEVYGRGQNLDQFLKFQPSFPLCNISLLSYYTIPNSSRHIPSRHGIKKGRGYSEALCTMINFI